MEAVLTQLVFEHTLRVRIGSHTALAKEEEQGEADVGLFYYFIYFLF